MLPYSAFISDRTQNLSDMSAWYWTLDLYDLVQIEDELRSATPLLRPYQVFATSAGADEDGPYMALVLVHADADSANQDAKLLPDRLEATQPILSSEFTVADSVKEVESRVEGKILMAKLRGDAAHGWLDAILRNDPLFIHE